MTTISDLTGRKIEAVLYPTPSIYVDSDTPVSNPDLYLGLELEIEGWAMGQRYNGLVCAADGSLRNNGVEWKTFPTKLRHLTALLAGFFKKFNVQPTNYSERCSTHVHVNVLDHTQEQLSTVLLLYQAFERLLFNFVDPDRRSNIFCVPWYQAGIGYDLINRVSVWDSYTFREWHKYTALNLRTINTFGTIEYRHLEGTCNTARIITWCNLLGCLHAYAKNTSFEAVKNTIINLNTSSAYSGFLQDVFREWTPEVMPPGYELFLEEGVLDCKYMLTQPSAKKVKIKTPDPERPAAERAAAGQAAAQGVFNREIERLQRIRREAVLAQIQDGEPGEPQGRVPHPPRPRVAPVRGGTIGGRLGFQYNLLDTTGRADDELLRNLQINPENPVNF